MLYIYNFHTNQTLNPWNWIVLLGIEYGLFMLDVFTKGSRPLDVLFNRQLSLCSLLDIRL